MNIHSNLLISTISRWSRLLFAAVKNEDSNTEEIKLIGNDKTEIVVMVSFE